jgi:coproporphyrinogen III oxidase-like Fe-S oxidoreductase
MRHEKVDLIFKAAIEVFAESGFDQAKMDDIAKGGRRCEREPFIITLKAKKNCLSV